MDCCGRLGTPVDVKAFRFGLCGRLWTALGDLRIRRLGVELGEFAESPPSVLISLRFPLSVGSRRVLAVTGFLGARQVIVMAFSNSTTPTTTSTASAARRTRAGRGR